MYKIINIYKYFQNPTRQPGWQVWHDGRFYGVWHTRAQARAAMREMREMQGQTIS